MEQGTDRQKMGDREGGDTERGREKQRKRVRKKEAKQERQRGKGRGLKESHSKHRLPTLPHDG